MDTTQPPSTGHPIDETESLLILQAACDAFDQAAAAGLRCHPEVVNLLAHLRALCACAEPGVPFQVRRSTRIVAALAAASRLQAGLVADLMHGAR